MNDEKPHHKDGMCMSCGGMVDADGYAHGGEVTDEDGDEMTRPKEVGDTSTQHVDVERMRSLGMALKGRR